MGVHASVLSLIAQMRRLGPFAEVKSIIELGDQKMGLAGFPQVIAEIYDAFGLAKPSNSEAISYHDRWTRDLYTTLGLKYASIDINATSGAIPLDLNFDQTPLEHKGAWDLVTNIGTTEHLINQANAFKTIHELAKPGGYILHHLPFVRYVDHGYFNYQPNFFDDLAFHNGYEMYGCWINIDRGRSHLIPWDRSLLDRIRLDNADLNIMVLFRKTSDADFALPVQGIYAEELPERAINRYEFVVDGRLVRGQQGMLQSRAAYWKDMELSQRPARELQRELVRRYVRAAKRLIQRVAR